MIEIGKRRNLAGQRFGKLTAIEPVRLLKSGSAVWKCLCDCGGYSSTASYNLLNGKTTACGCIHLALASKLNKTHGLRGHSAANSWYNMHDRCYDKNSKSYVNYGARGIKVEDVWHSLENFVKDMGDKPKGKTLERKDNNKDYGPGNCIWASVKEQNRNRRNTKIVVYRGENFVFVELAELKGIKPSTARERLARGWSVDRTFDTPVQ